MGLYGTKLDESNLTGTKLQILESKKKGDERFAVGFMRDEEDGDEEEDVEEEEERAIDMCRRL